VVVALEVPLKVTVAPDPPAAGLKIPEIVKVCGVVALLTVTVTGELVVLLPAPSVAMARKVWVALGDLVESQG
jgi:hypothetical protein